jgi:uncharacterized protein CbrC (UPF0167 family)
LVQQLLKRHPELDQVAVERLAEEHTDELQFRTPHVTTWQDFLWPAHCGDYCCFIKEAGKPDLVAIAPDGQTRSFFELSDDNAFQYVWEGIRPDSPKDCSTAYSIGVYLFQCLACHEYVVLWDQE